MARVLIAALLVVLLAACAGPAVGGATLTGSGNPVSRSYDLSGFSRIDANTAAQVEVTRGSAYSVEVKVDDNLASRLAVSVTGDTLTIKLQDGSYNHVTLRAQVTMPKLDGVTLNGGSSLRGELAGEDLSVNLNGGTRATLSGTAGRVTIDVNGGSQALLGDLAAQDVHVTADAGSRVEIQASGAVTGSANGGAQVIVSGSPTSVNVQTDGGATVTTK
jgi:hypothetical protein